MPTSGKSICFSDIDTAGVQDRLLNYEPEGSATHQQHTYARTKIRTHERTKISTHARKYTRTHACSRKEHEQLSLFVQKNYGAVNEKIAMLTEARSLRTMMRHARMKV